jgi:16S rRNA (guanine527-N7)-methyltransferase
LSRSERLVQDAATLGVTLTSAEAARLLALTEELSRWNRRYNLTAISTPAAMVTHHLLDSLAVHPDIVGTRIADVGTGAGFPGLPLALCNPRRHFTLIDSTAKKLRFVAHAAELLELANVTTVHARVESLKPAAPFDTVLARAFAPLPRLLEKAAPLCGQKTQLLALKGRWPAEELAALPPDWSVLRSRELHVPGLDAARCLIVLTRADAANAALPGV